MTHKYWGRDSSISRNKSKRNDVVHTYFNDTEAIASRDLSISEHIRMAVDGNCKTRKFYN